jgi:hypothetical protein
VATELALVNAGEAKQADKRGALYSKLHALCAPGMDHLDGDAAAFEDCGSTAERSIAIGGLLWLPS